MNPPFQNIDLFLLVPWAFNKDGHQVQNFGIKMDRYGRGEIFRGA